MVDFLIFTASYGGGHWQAARALDKTLHLGREGVTTEIVDFVELISPVLNRVTRYTYVTSVRNTPSLYGYFYKVTDHLNYDALIRTQFTNATLSKIRKFLATRSPRVIVATYSMAAAAISYLKKQGLVQALLVTVITDNTSHSQWVHSETDCYLVASEQVKEGLIQLGVVPDRVAVTGIPIDPKFSQILPRDPLYRKFGLKPDLPVILLMTGAVGLLKGVASLCRMLDRCPVPFQVLVVTGRDKQLYRRLQELAPDFVKPFKIYQFVNNVEEFMAVSDLLITKAGGLTMSEALASGLPMIIYRPIPGQEEENTNYLIEEQAALAVQDHKELRSALQLLLTDHDLFEQMRRRARAIGRPEAARDAAAVLLDLIDKGVVDTTAKAGGTGSRMR